nr:hypothetical protein [uncultured Campylobacter sp.]
MDALRRLCVWADVRSLFRTSQSKDGTHAESVRIRLYKLHEPIKFYKFPLCLTSERLRFIIARTAKFLPHEQFALEFYYRLKFYAAVRDLNFAETICARLHFG